MAEGKFIAYYRVSTAKQGISRLGLEAQQKAVRDYLNGGNWELIQEVTEIESGKRSDRPQLAEALRFCRLYNAKLVIAKLDRLARNVAFVSALMEAKVSFVAVDLPTANNFTVHIFSAAAEHEAKAISDRTKAALAASKARGRKLGGLREGGFGQPEQRLVGQQRSIQTRQAKALSFAADVSPFVTEMRQAGMSLRTIAADLNAKQIPTARGKAWTAMAVQRIIKQ
jgi:DNA invertase Pin-like site-specific DNA recombinase